MKFEEARKAMVSTFKKDEDLRQVYISNIACVIMDNAEGYDKDKAKRDKLAAKIFNHIFNK